MWFELLKDEPEFRRLTGEIRMGNLIKESVRDFLLKINIGDTFSIQDIVDSADDERITPQILMKAKALVNNIHIEKVMIPKEAHKIGWKIAKRFKKVK
jgi:hypothetical protein